MADAPHNLRLIITDFKNMLLNKAKCIIVDVVTFCFFRRNLIHIYGRSLRCKSFVTVFQLRKLTGCIFERKRERDAGEGMNDCLLQL